MLVIGRPCRLRKINDAAGIGNELGGVARSIVVETNVRRSGNAGEGAAARKRMDGSRACLAEALKSTDPKSSIRAAPAVLLLSKESSPKSIM